MSCPLTRRSVIKVYAHLVLLAYLLAIGAATAKAQPRQPPAFWVRDAICETGWNPPDWRYGAPGHHGDGSGYEGGIGFAPSTWRWWAGVLGHLHRYPHAYLAPAWVQAAVAQYGLDHYGRWGCVGR